MKLLKYSIDRRSLLIVFLCLFLQTYVLTLDLGQTSALFLIFLFVIGVLLCHAVTLINHNHRHLPTFTISFFNRSLNLLISILIGAPSTRLHLIHHWNHHRFFRDERDWSSYKTNARGRGPRRLFTYLWLSTRNMRQNRKHLRMPIQVKKMLLWEQISLYLSILVFTFINWQMLVFFILPLRASALFILLMGNLANHDQCELESPYNHSRNFTNPIENWLFFNVGFHSAHHENPALHWSRLPELHQKKYVPFTRQDLQLNSYFSYLFKTYLFSIEHNDTRS